MRIRLPDMLVIIVVLGGHNDTVGNKESGVESHTKLSDQVVHVLVLVLSSLLQELAGARFGDGSQVLGEVFLGHTDTSVSDVQHIVFFVHLDLNGHFLGGFKGFFVTDGNEADLVQGIRGIRDQLTKEDLKHIKKIAKLNFIKTAH